MILLFIRRYQLHYICIVLYAFLSEIVSCSRFTTGNVIQRETYPFIDQHFLCAGHANSFGSTEILSQLYWDGKSTFKLLIIFICSHWLTSCMYIHVWQIFFQSALVHGNPTRRNNTTFDFARNQWYQRWSCSRNTKSLGYSCSSIGSCQSDR